MEKLVRNDRTLHIIVADETRTTSLARTPANRGGVEESSFLRAADKVMRDHAETLRELSKR